MSDDLCSQSYPSAIPLLSLKSVLSLCYPPVIPVVSSSVPVFLSGEPNQAYEPPSGGTLKHRSSQEEEQQGQRGEGQD